MKSTFVEDWAAASPWRVLQTEPKAGTSSQQGSNVKPKGFCHAVSSWSPAGATWLDGRSQSHHCAEDTWKKGPSRKQRWDNINSPHHRKTWVSISTLSDWVHTLGATAPTHAVRRRLQPRGCPPSPTFPGPRAALKQFVCGCMYHRRSKSRSAPPRGRPSWLPVSPGFPSFPSTSSCLVFFFFSLQYLHRGKASPAGHTDLNKMQGSPGHLHGDCRSSCTFSLRHAVKI